MKLSSLQKQVLAQIAWEARISPEQVAKNLSARPHTIRYAIRQLRERLNLQPYCFIDPFKIGLLPYRALFSIDSGDRVRCQAMIKYLQTAPEVVWFFELYGHYQFLLALRVRSTQHLEVFLRNFDSRFGDMIVSKALAEMVRTTCYIPRLAYSGKGPRPCVEYRHDSMLASVDDTDLRILGKLKEHPLAPIGALARSAGLPASTTNYRFEKLVKAGVILGFMYGYDSQVADTSAYLILVKLQGIGGGLHERFFEFAQYHPLINRVTRMIGEWDLEFEVQLDSSHDISLMIHELYRHGAGCIKAVLPHTWGIEHEVTNSSVRPS